MKKILVILFALVLFAIPVNAGVNDLGTIDAECQAYGYDFGVARWDWNSANEEYDLTIQHSDYVTSVTGTNAQAQWTSSPGIDSILSKEVCNYQVLPGGEDGTVDKYDVDFIEHITFCADETEPEKKPECKNSDVMLVIDRSNSMSGDKLTKAQNAAKLFVDLMNMDGDGDKAGVVSFSTNMATLVQGLTIVSQDVKSSIDSLTASGLTCISCGIETAQKEIDDNGRNEDVSKVMIVLTDGYPTSEDTAELTLQAADAAKAAGTTIFTIGIGDADPDLMQDVASIPEYFSYGTEDDLDAIYTAIAGEICAGGEEEIPEFGTVAAGIALVGAIGVFAVFRRSRK